MRWCEGGDRSFRRSAASAGGSLDAERRAAAAGRLRVRVLDRESAAGDVVDEIDFGAAQVARADRIHEQLDAVRVDHRVGRRVPLALVDHEAVLEARASPALNEHAETRLGLVLFLEQLRDLAGRSLSYVDHSVLIIHWAYGPDPFLSR